MRFPMKKLAIAMAFAAALCWVRADAQQVSIPAGLAGPLVTGGALTFADLSTANALLATTTARNVNTTTTGTGVLTALGVNIGSAGAFVVNGGALGTPSSGTATNITGLLLAGLATQATNTVVGNATSGTAVPTALAVGTCSTAASALIWTTNTGFGCNTSITAAAAPASGLTGNTLASGVTASSLTSHGVLAAQLLTTGGVNNTASQTHLGWDTTAGAQLLGSGATSDITLYNKNGSPAMTVPTGTQNIAAAAQIVATAMTQTSAAQSGTVCNNTGGTLTYDATLGCLASDERLKEKISPLGTASKILMALQPMTYRWKEGASSRFADDPGEHIGLGAFATSYADERLIARGGDGQPRGWRQDAMIALLVAAVQEQQVLIAELRKAR
jgi:hypothetical protein